MTTDQPTQPDPATEAPGTTEPTWLRRFECEDPAAGLYLHSRTPTTVITSPEGETVLVDAVAFMAMQKERDDLRRVVGLINAWRRTPGRSESRLEALLASVGLDDEAADAMRGVLAGIRAMRESRA